MERNWHNHRRIVLLCRELHSVKTRLKRKGREVVLHTSYHLIQLFTPSKFYSLVHAMTSCRDPVRIQDRSAAPVSAGKTEKRRPPHRDLPRPSTKVRVLPADYPLLWPHRWLATGWQIGERERRKSTIDQTRQLVANCVFNFNIRCRSFKFRFVFLQLP